MKNFLNSCLFNILLIRSSYKRRHHFSYLQPLKQCLFRLCSADNTPLLYIKAKVSKTKHIIAMALCIPKNTTF